VRRVVAIACATFLALSGIARAVTPQRILFVPLDDRPVTDELPMMLGSIAGVSILEPPHAFLGNYLQAGSSDPIGRWLARESERKRVAGAVISTDMLAYGGLVASRLPGPSYADAYFRLGAIARLHRQHPNIWISAFATVMRLAPTGVPSIGAATNFFAAYPIWTYLQRYANLPDPLPRRDRSLAARLRARIGPVTLDAYLAARARNLDVDRFLILDTRADAIARLVIGQDDAGPIGLHVPEIAQLRTMLEEDIQPGTASIEPGADELGMVLVAHAMARQLRWHPRVRVEYSQPAGATVQDPLEFEPIGATITSLLALAGARPVRRAPDLTLIVRVPGTTADQDDALVKHLQRLLAMRRSIAFVDLTFLGGSNDAELAFMQRLLHDGVAARLDAYAAWNTDANSVGTALAEAIAAGVGRRNGHYDARAHLNFTFDRILDDVYFRALVRPELERWLLRHGIADHTYLLPSVARRTELRARALLWQYAPGLLASLAPNEHIAAMRITLPWNRTFEIQIDPALAPDLY